MDLRQRHPRTGGQSTTVHTYPVRSTQHTVYGVIPLHDQSNFWKSRNTPGVRWRCVRPVSAVYWESCPPECSGRLDERGELNWIDASHYDRFSTLG